MMLVFSCSVLNELQRHIYAFPNARSSNVRLENLLADLVVDFATLEFSLLHFLRTI